MGGSQSKGKNAGELQVLNEHRAPINCVAMSEDGSLLVTGSDDCTARMWSVKTERTECLGVLKGHASHVLCVAVCETFVITGSADMTIKKWDMTDVKCIFTYEGHTGRVNRVICTPDYIFSTSFDKTAKCWKFDVNEDEDGDACLRTFKGHTLSVLPLIYIPADDEEPVSDEEDEETEDNFINQGDLLITGSCDSTAISWSVESGSRLKTFRGHSGAVNCMATDSKGQTLFTGSQDGLIKSWNIVTGQLLHDFSGHTGPVMCIQVSKKLLYSGSADGTGRCFVAEYGDSTRVYKGHQNTVNQVYFKEGLLYTACGDGVARVFDATSNAERKHYTGHTQGIVGLAVSNNKFYTGSSDGTIRCWDSSNIPVDTKFSSTGEDDEEDVFSQSQQGRMKAIEQHIDDCYDVDDLGSKASKQKSIQ